MYCKHNIVNIVMVPGSVVKMKAIITYTDEQFSRPIAYIFNLIFPILGIEYEIMLYSELIINRIVSDNLLISYGRRKPNLNAAHQIHIYQSELFSGNYRTLSSMPQLPLRRWNDLPVIYEGNGEIGSLVTRSGNIIETNIDMIASSFFMLSRYEEILVNEKDQSERFPAQSSVAYKENFLTKPIVNEYIELLWKWINSFNLGFKRRLLWDGKDFTACLTHDVDSVRKWTGRGIYDEVLHWGNIALKKRELLTAVSKIAKACTSILNPNDPYWNFEWIMDIEKQYGFSSSFYFFGFDSKHLSDADYSLQENRILRLVSKIQDRGCEVGLHGSYHSYNDLGILQREKANLEKLVGKVYSVRQHALRFDIRETFAIHEKLGIKCDVTLGFAQHEGFRAGFCLPFHPYNIEEDRPFDMLELPLATMDNTLSSAKYRGLDAEKAWQNIESLLAAVKSCGGCIVLLFHNSHLDILNHTDYIDIYKQCLKYISENNGDGMSTRQVIERYCFS